MTVEKTNRITGHQVTIMPPAAAGEKTFGWVRLLDGTRDAGFVYLEHDFHPPHLSADGSYIVTAVPFEQAPFLLDLLRNERELQIRYFDPQAANGTPSVFIEPQDPSPSPARVASRLEAVSRDHPGQAQSAARQ